MFRVGRYIFRYESMPRRAAGQIIVSAFESSPLREVVRKVEGSRCRRGILVINEANGFYSSRMFIWRARMNNDVST